MLLNTYSMGVYRLTTGADPDWKLQSSIQAFPELNPSLNFDQRVLNGLRMLATGISLIVGWFGMEIVEDREVSRILTLEMFFFF